MVSVSLSIEPPASGFKRMTALADGLMLVFQNPGKGNCSDYPKPPLTGEGPKP
jgi:hypothetical protein